MKIEITWYGHACFTVEASGYRIVLDPYDPAVPGYGPLALTANQVLCSHGHGDHSYTQAVTLQSGPDSPFTVTALETFHDDVQGTKRGNNRIHILEADGGRIAHLGDIGHMPGPEVMNALKGVDAMLIPVGGCYTVDAATADAIARAAQPRVVIPMHYRTGTYGYAEIGAVDNFLALRPDVRLYETNALFLNADTPTQTAVLRYMAP